MTLLMAEPDLSQIHIPVLLSEVVKAFAFDRPAIVVDGTVGIGGHTEALLDAYPEMRVIGIEWDTSALVLAKQRLARFGERFVTVEGSYAELTQLLPQYGVARVDGLFLDLGLSSKQLSDRDRGFSFRMNGPLDMRMSASLHRTAWDILQQSDEQSLTEIFRTWGEEPHGRRVAHALRQAVDRGQLRNDAAYIAECIRLALPYHGGKTDPATRCFQALRIVVNGELANLEQILTGLEVVLAPGARAAIISYHSLEDRRVKTAFRKAATGCICPPDLPFCACGKTPWAKLIVRKSIQPSDEEVARNPRSRSARMRLLEKL